MVKIGISHQLSQNVLRIGRHIDGDD